MEPHQYEGMHGVPGHLPISEGVFLAMGVASLGGVIVYLGNNQDMLDFTFLISRSIILISMTNGAYKLSPSDFAYLWNDCKFCYYQKVKPGISHSGVFPAMFGRINGLLQISIIGQNFQDIHPDLPSGIVKVQEGF